MFFLAIVQRIRCGAVMRLTDLQRTIIRETVAETFCAGANV